MAEKTKAYVYETEGGEFFWCVKDMSMWSSSHFGSVDEAYANACECAGVELELRVGGDGNGR